MNDNELQINAWFGGEGGARGRPSVAIDDWAARPTDTLRPHEALFAGKPPTLSNWQEVGWGVVLRDNTDEDAKRKGAAEDAPAAVQRLLAQRPGSLVFRYRPELGTAYFMHYELDGTERKFGTVEGEIGPGKRQLPRYLLIVGSPVDIPWRVQYVLNGTHFVGRLDLDDAGLENYVDALLDGWSGSAASRRSVVIWTTDGGRADITWDMRHTLAEPLRRLFEPDPDVESLTHLAGEQASCDALAKALLAHQPGLIVTTSHGATLVDRGLADLREALGRPVDQHQTVLPQEGLGDWSPGGAIWYAHACCSAGADAETLYADIAAPDSDVAKVIAGVALAGSCTAPLPTELLGRRQPLRAFVGHVEPTFNWTLKDPTTNQPKTSDLRDALYEGLFQEHGEPIGLALNRHYARIGSLWSQWNSQGTGIKRGVQAAYDAALAARLSALDRQSLVILGDPTVTVPQD